MFNKWLFTDVHQDKLGSATEPAPTMSSLATSALTDPSVAATMAPLGVDGSSGKPGHSFFRSGTKGISSYNFAFPLTVTCLHQFLVWLLVYFFEKPLSRVSGEISRSPKIMYAVAPIGAICGLDWGLSNFSLRSITLSLYEMVKACSPMLVLILASFLGLQTLDCKLICIILIVVFGLFFSISGGDIHVFSQHGFPVAGFGCVAVATLLSATRVVFAQRVLQHWKEAHPVSVGKETSSGSGGFRETHRLVDPTTGTSVGHGQESGSIGYSAVDRSLGTGVELVTVGNSAGGSASTSIGAGTVSTSQEFQPPQDDDDDKQRKAKKSGLNSITVMYYAAPASSAALVLPALYIEGSRLRNWWHTHSTSDQLGVVTCVLGSSTLALALSIAELVVTRKTSALTLCIVGISKQALIVALAMLFFGERPAGANLFGFVLTLIGIGAYNIMKLKERAQAGEGSGGSGDSESSSPASSGSPQTAVLVGGGAGGGPKWVLSDK